MSQRQSGFLWVLIAILGYAFLPVFTRKIYANSELLPSDISIWRFMIATPSIWLILLLREKFSKQTRKTNDSPKQIFKLMAMGLCYALAALSAVASLQYVSAGTYSVLFYTYPAIVALIGFFIGQRLQIAGWIALALTLVGVVLTVPGFSLSGDNTMLGVVISLVNALIVAIYFSIISYVMKNASSVLRGSAWVITGTFGFLILTIPFFGLHAPNDSSVWYSLIGLGIISTALPILLMNMAIQSLGATQTSIIATLQPILTIALAFFLINESVLLIQIVGAALIIAGVILLELAPKQKLAH